ncbi:hypothetical protein [Jannaschia donghaensis]|uniref:Uncharacterized protein n=1 Tax=Jannaschia donghaensis TaxID=420998 RepID=A0A0M6YP83_9RHOB|nr:hypothetical protein [Jannaschia donghaensis]CTQ51353.1 hypothetical protein JDO7802_03392 [Jannaschia donghaensis]
MRQRDTLLVWNERVRLFAGFLNALALGLVGFAVLRPLTEDVALLSGLSAGWAAVGLAIHVAAHYVMGQLKKEDVPDDL